MPRRFHWVISFLILLLGSLLSSHSAWAGAPAWTMKADHDIDFLKLTPLGNLVISTDKDLSALDPSTGVPQWKREDIRDLRLVALDLIPNTPLAIVHRNEDDLDLMDLNTGRTLWDSRALGLRSTHGQFEVPGRRMLVIYGTSKKKSKKVFMAVDEATGEHKWTQMADDWFDKEPELFNVPGSEDSYARQSLDGNQGPVFDAGHGMILCVTSEGLIDVDLDTGRRLWRTELDMDAPPATRRGFCPMLLSDGVVYVPYEKRLVAVRASDGKVLWDDPPKFKSQVAQMEMTPRGLLVRGVPAHDKDGNEDGKPFLVLLDPATGERAWKKPFKDLEKATSFVVKDDQVFVAVDDELVRVSLSTGKASTLSKYDFDGGESPAILELRTAGLLLESSQNLQMFDFGGKLAWKVYHKAPGSSLFSKVAGTALAVVRTAASSAYQYAKWQAYGDIPSVWIAGSPALSRRFKASLQEPGSTYMLTDVHEGEDSGPGLVRVNRDTGAVESQVILDEKHPVYELDDVNNLLFFKKSDQEVACFKM
jgi:outer membrane protein assembly factor BamB